MQHPIGVASLVVAAVAYALGWGPLLLLAGLSLEIGFWHARRRDTTAARAG